MNEAIVSNTANPDDLSTADYYTKPLTEAQLAYEREKAAKKAAAKATLIAEQRMLERNIPKLLRKLTPEEVADALEVPLDQVNKIAAKQYSVSNINGLRGNTSAPPAKTTEVGNKLTFMHGAAPISNLAYLRMLSNSPYFVSRRNEVQLAELRDEAETQVAEIIIYKLLKQFSPEEVVGLLKAPLDQVHRIAKSNYSRININNIYKAAVSVTDDNPDGISTADYYIKPLTKAQLAYERKKTERKTVEGTIYMLLEKLSPEVVADALEMPFNQVFNISEGSYFNIDFKSLW